VLLELASHSLLSIVQLCDAGCVVFEFTATINVAFDTMTFSFSKAITTAGKLATYNLECFVRKRAAFNENGHIQSLPEPINAKRQLMCRVVAARTG
jgi:hypothetical protein